MTDVAVTVLPHGRGLDLPAHAEPQAAGLDLRAAVPPSEPITLAPGQHALVPTGLQIALPHGTEGQVRPPLGAGLQARRHRAKLSRNHRL